MYSTPERSEEYQNPKSPLPPEQPDSQLCRNALFQIAIRFTAYCLLLQSILPCFAWAADVQAPPVALQPHLDRRVEPQFIYLPQIHQELKATQDNEQKSQDFVMGNHRIDISNIEASIKDLEKIYTGLHKVDEGYAWFAHGLRFTYTPTDLHIEGKPDTPKGNILKIDKINKENDHGKSDVGKIIIGQGLQLDTLIALDTCVENRGAHTLIKNLSVKHFFQKEGSSLTTQKLICSAGFGNSGIVTAAENLYLEISGKALNLNTGTIKAATLQLKLLDESQFLNNSSIISSSSLEVTGNGTFIEGKESQLQTPSLSLNSRRYENYRAYTTPHACIVVGSHVRAWTNHEGAVLKATSMEFKAVDGIFKNFGEMELGTWTYGAHDFHNEVTGKITVTGETTFTNLKTLINEGTFEFKGSVKGRVDDLTNAGTGELKVAGDLELDGDTFVNENLVDIKKVAKWKGQTLKNSGRLVMKRCDIAAHRQFINSGLFFWKYYTPRASQIINLGIMKQTQDLKQELKFDYVNAKEKIAKDFTYVPLSVDNRGEINLQTDYQLKYAAHQKTTVRFQQWHNSGIFLDKGRELRAEIFNNTGDYRTNGALTGKVKNFTSTDKLYAKSVALTCEDRLKLSGLFESRGKVSLTTKHYEDDTKLKMTADALEVKGKAIPLTIAGDIQVTKDLTLNAYSGRITGKITQQTGKATFEGRHLTLAPQGELNVNKFHFAGRPTNYNVPKWWLINNTLTLEGKFVAGAFSGDNIHVLEHASPHPLALQGIGYTYISSLKLIGTGDVYLGTGLYSFGEFSNQSLCEILGNVHITKIANNNRIHLKENATLRLHEGNSGIIESPTSVSMLLPGNEDREKDIQGAKVVCLSDKVTVPTLHTQSESTVYLHPEQNAALFISDHLDRQAYPNEAPLRVYGSFFDSIENFTYPKSLDLMVGDFYNNHELKFGPSKIYVCNFRNGTSASQRGSIQFTGESEIKVINNLENRWGIIKAVHPKNRRDRLNFPGNLTLISETGDIRIGAITPSYTSTGSFAAASGHLKLFAAQKNIFIEYADLATGPELKDIWAGDLELKAKQVIQTRTSNLHIGGGASIAAQTFNHCGGGRSTLTSQDSNQCMKLLVV